jgi:calpain-15
VAEVKDKNGKPTKLVQLRNPWGKFEWAGDWGDNSNCWTPALKKQLNHTADANDGTFWMNFYDFTQYFSRV